MICLLNKFWNLEWLVYPLDKCGYLSALRNACMLLSRELWRHSLAKLKGKKERNKKENVRARHSKSDSDMSVRSWNPSRKNWWLLPPDTDAHRGEISLWFIGNPIMEQAGGGSCWWCLTRTISSPGRDFDIWISIQQPFKIWYCYH